MQEKTEAITKMKVNSQKDLRRFLGMCNFLRRHIKGFVHLSHELTELLKKNVVWQWTEKHEVLINENKQAITTGDAIGVPKPRGEFVLWTDASDYGGSGSLFQWQFKGREEISKLPDGQTTGMHRDGTLRHNRDPEMWMLVPIGH